MTDIPIYDTAILLVNFNYGPDEDPGRMLIAVKADDLSKAAEIVNTTYTVWKEAEHDDGCQVSTLEECIEAALTHAGVWFLIQRFDVVNLDV